jgi:DNA-binding SARP family transcriptional activator
VRLRFCTLGAALVEVGRVSVTPASGLLFSLLVRLAHTPGMGVTREQLVAELWPGHDPIRQRANLRQALYKLRAMGVRVAVGGEVVSLDPRQVAPSFSMERTAARFEEQVLAGAEPIGRFLPGVTAERGDFAEWLELQRGLVQGEARRVLVDTLRRRRDQGDFGGTEVVARALLQLDPLNEEATLLLAECTLLAGARAEGVQLLDRYLAEVGEVPEEVRRRVMTLRRRIHEPQPGVSRVRETPLGETLFVGREAELAQLSKALRHARWQDGGAVLVHGAPGIGKSRLAVELGRVAQLEGFREVRLSCREGDEGSGFHLLATLVSQLLSLPGALGCSPEGLRRLRRQWPDGDRGAVFPVAEQAPIDAVEQAATREALVDLVTALAEERPLLVVVEDVHWLDAGSWQVLQLFAGAATGIRLFLLFTARERNPPQLRAVALAPRLGVMALEPLAAGPLAQLAGALLGAGHATPGVDTPREAEVTARLAAASQGNPLFLRALVQHWADTGEVEGIPRTLSGLLETRMNRLPEGARLALQAIVLLGPLATTERLVAVLGVGTSALVEAVEALTAADCIRSVPPNHVMSHDLVGRAALARLSVAGRAVLHGAIADVLAAERERTGAPALLLPVLEQLLLAGRWAEWGTALVAAQDQVLALGNPAPVLGQAETVKGHAPGMLAAHGVRGVLAQLQAQAGNYEASLRLAGDVTGLAGRIAELGEREVAALLTYLESAYHSESNADHRFLALSLAELAENRSIPGRLRLSAALRGLVVAINSSESTAAERCHRVATTLEGDIASSRTMTEFLMIFECHFGSFAKAAALAHSLMDSLDRSIPSTETAALLFRSGTALRKCGLLSEAVTAITDAFQMYLTLNLRHVGIDCLVLLSSMARSRGEIATCNHWEFLLEELVLKHDDTRAIDHAILYLARAAIEDRDAALLRKRISGKTCLQLKGTGPSARLIILAVLLASNSLLQIGPVDTEVLESALRTYWGNCRIGGFNDFPVAILGSTLVLQGRADEARCLVKDYVTQKRRSLEPLAICLQQVADELGLSINPREYITTS